jgi:hypothetical protein
VQRWRTLAEADALREEVKQLEERVEQKLTAGRSSSSSSQGSGSSGPTAGDLPVGGTSNSCGRGPKVEHGGECERRQRRPAPPNPYDRGVWHNLGEVLFPHHYLRLAASSPQDASDSKKQW